MRLSILAINSNSKLKFKVVGIDVEVYLI